MVGFVLVSVVSRKEKEVYEAMKEIEEVVDVHPLFGEYDIIAKVEAETHEAVGNVVVDKVRKLPGVVETKTLIRVGD